jgi:diaminopimelate epimerase
VRFAKLHGAGNDFLLFDGRHDAGLADLIAPLVPRLCHRRLGIGADGVLVVEESGAGIVRLRYWNGDGSNAAFCANGTRCAARFVAERWGWRTALIRTGHGEVVAEVAGDRVTLQLPAPETVQAWRTLSLAGGEVRCRYLEVGVPHLVVPVDWHDFWQHPLAPLAPALRHHPELPPGGANVTFLHHSPAGQLQARSFERGVEGETLSCGSGVVAAGLVALEKRWCASPASILTASGRTLEVSAEGAPPACPTRLVGPAEWICEGEISPELLSSVPGPWSPIPGAAGSATGS